MCRELVVCWSRSETDWVSVMRWTSMDTNESRSAGRQHTKTDRFNSHRGAAVCAIEFVAPKARATQLG